MILFEHPFTERIRFFIRLEYLFQRLFAFSKQFDAESQHVTLMRLFDIMEICERGDCRSWILQEIEKLKISLESYRSFPEVDLAVLDATVHRLTLVAKYLANSHKMGSHIRENEWLMNLKNRFQQAGATSPIDTPSYHAWQNIPENHRIQLINELIRPFMPLYEALAQILKILRESADADYETTGNNGVYERAMGGRLYQLVRLWVPTSSCVYPEISGNKHVLMIRFFTLNDHFRQKLLMEPISFKIALCNI